MAKQRKQPGNPKADSAKADSAEPARSTNPPPPKPSEREGRPEAPRHDESKPAAESDPSSRDPSQSGHALPDRQTTDPGKARDSLHIPSRIDRA